MHAERGCSVCVRAPLEYSREVMMEVHAEIERVCARTTLVVGGYGYAREFVHHACCSRPAGAGGWARPRAIANGHRVTGATIAHATEIAKRMPINKARKKLAKSSYVFLRGFTR